MLVFLDFDGVLHPFPCHYALHFCQRDLLEGFFRQSAQADAHLIISSTWRNHYPLDELRRWFSPDFRERIIGCTPTLDGIAWEGSREREKYKHGCNNTAACTKHGLRWTICRHFSNPNAIMFISATRPPDLPKKTAPR